GLTRRDLRQLRHDDGGAVEPLFRRRPVADEDNALVRPDLGHGALFADHLHQPDRIVEGRIAELDDHALRTGVELLDIRTAAERLDVNDLEQMLHFFGHRAETVDKFRTESIDILRLFQVCETAIKAETQLKIGHIGFRYHHRRADSDLRRPLAVFNLDRSLESSHGFFQHLLVKLETDFLDMSGLLLA